MKEGSPHVARRRTVRRATAVRKPQSPQADGQVGFADQCQKGPDATATDERTPHTAGAVLYDARALFDAQNPQADGLLRSVVADLPAAVAACATAAAAELDPVRQAALLKVRPKISHAASCTPLSCFPFRAAFRVRRSSDAGLVLFCKPSQVMPAPGPYVALQGFKGLRLRGSASLPLSCACRGCVSTRPCLSCWIAAT